jgi:hypothetical protein
MPRTVPPPARIETIDSRRAAVTLGGRPRGSPLLAMRSRAAEMRSLMGVLSSFAARLTLRAAQGKMWMHLPGYPLRTSRSKSARLHKALIERVLKE